MTGARWLASLVGKLREAGLVVPPARLLDGARALLVADDLVVERDTLQVVLRVVLAQTRAARPIFDRVFDSFIKAHGPPRSGPKTGPRGPAGAVDAHSGGGRAASHGATSPLRKPVEPTGTRPGSIPRIGEEARRNSAEERGEASGDPPLDAPDAVLAAWAERVWREQERASPAPPADPCLEKGADGAVRLGKGPEGLSHVGKGAGGSSRFGRPARVPADEPPRPPLTAEMLEAVRRMASALWLRRSRRSRRFKRGRVDMKATLGHSFRTDGMPFRILRRKRRLQRARLLLLLDVSGSMRECAPFVLALARGMREAFLTVSVLAFVDHPVWIHDLDTAEMNWMSQSDYGNTFFKLLGEHDRRLRKDVLLVVMGDARNNFTDPMEWAFAEVRARVGWMLWLNPEARSRWNTGDSVLSRYAPWCDAMLRCASLADLKKAAEVLVARAGRWRGSGRR